MDDLLRGREALFIHGEEHRTQTNNTVSTKECNYLITATTVMLVAAEGMRIAHNVLTPAGGSKFLAQSSQISSRSARVTSSSVLTQARSSQSMRCVTEIEERDWAW